MLYGHVDVVTTVGQQWAQPPFGGEHRRRLRVGPRRARHEGRRRDVRRRVHRGARGGLPDAAAAAGPERRGERRRRGRDVHRRRAPRALRRREARARRVRRRDAVDRRPALLSDPGRGEAAVLAARARARHRRPRRARRARAARCGSSATCCARSTASSRRCTSSRSSATGSRRWPPSCRARRRSLLRRLLDPKTADLAARALGPRGRQLEPRDPQHRQPDDRPRRRQDQRHPERGRAAARRAAPARLQRRTT